MNTASPYLRRGRLFVVAYLLCQSSLAVLLIVLTLVNQQDIAKNLFKVASGALMMYGLWCGSKWVKWFHAVSFFLVAVICAYICLNLPRAFAAANRDFFTVLFGGTSLFLFCLAYAFSFSRSVNEFLAHQRGEYIETEAAQIVERAKQGDSGESIDGTS